MKFSQRRRKSKQVEKSNKNLCFWNITSSTQQRNQVSLKCVPSSRSNIWTPVHSDQKSHLLSGAHGCLLQGLGSLKLSLPSVEGAEVLQGRRHCGAGEKQTSGFYIRTDAVCGRGILVWKAFVNIFSLPCYSSETPTNSPVHFTGFVPASVFPKRRAVLLLPLEDTHSPASARGPKTSGTLKTHRLGKVIQHTAEAQPTFKVHFSPIKSDVLGSESVHPPSSKNYLQLWNLCFINPR